MAGPERRLYLITPWITAAAVFARALESALGGADIACVLLRLAETARPAAADLIAALAPAVQHAGAALLVEEDVELALRVDADGVHVRGAGATLRHALERLKPARIVGAGGLALRDDAMIAGDCGVDYVMFGEPQGDRPQAPAATVERIAWWSEIFTPPCVGFAGAIDDVGALAAAGADFIALGNAIWSDPRGPTAAVRDAQRRLLEHAEPPG